MKKEEKDWTNPEIVSWLKKVSNEAQTIVSQKSKQGIEECTSIFNALLKSAKAAKKEFVKQHKKV